MKAINVISHKIFVIFFFLNTFPFMSFDLINRCLSSNNIYELLEALCNMIRVDSHDLDEEIIWKGGSGTVKNSISQSDLIKDLKENGCEIIEYKYSSFGQCYFFKIRGEYSGKIKVNKLNIRPCDFDWNI